MKVMDSKLLRDSSNDLGPLSGWELPELRGAAYKVNSVCKMSPLREALSKFRSVIIFGQALFEAPFAFLASV